MLGVHKGKLTYNTALMQRAFLARYFATGERKDLATAKKISEGAERFLGRNEKDRYGEGAYHDPVKWSHLMVEADIEFYRATEDRDALRRAKATADAVYESWREKKLEEAIQQGSLARMLWLLADLEVAGADQDWRELEKLAKTHQGGIRQGFGL
jgi:uncharacterized protein YyaL (SSP411 family)